MGKCPFLSSSNKYVECFENCAFYNLEDTNGECPFKSITGKSNNKIRKLHYNDYMDEEYVLDFEEEYEKVEYL
ncbi:hypothetical protein CPAST_c15100 [Clostridium pasteurianum DSM 525 = ATCC 6013]|uniref:Uncharacterized protein n=1 Tax=Clostridium pasteurianum DSM 525 = ATCC 6013 TaxID=1262449 RepID=A0A0H3J905_CLOPA|nr:hypothetical protein [Clostridium pasteurianum]AJA47585.1 hypothetical protein CPAST_c15100 [Clostridium pasteurianum DSM 525 = ATCC 6013]AJA51573.1 hypothetical protein CLPA_c15100 [Clostridium pasteurianum DSM 525 = ATCC 6013]AOZ74900.1 hypothetical protein AQ983_07300 [Clostridium pasteurianum DSM 525 = ATCC 6013]AOZ78695.1 hypothetical protein AQ984_07290 [Clostridium pasteurianum]ELP58074.1 hypothetical protein F502_16545 [Clostridium pasteurianum DSM 525 = ATCC 6013]